jgi:hypothetical protein
MSSEMIPQRHDCSTEQGSTNAPFAGCPNFPVNPGNRGYAATGSIGGPRIATATASAASQATLPNLFIQ